MKNRLVFIAYVLGDIEDLVHFYPQYFHSNTFKLQFDREDRPPPPLPPLIILYRA